MAVANACGDLADERAVESLIPLLKDPEHSVRTVAANALDAIEFYHTRVDHWRQWKSRSKGLDTIAALEKLLAQAAEGRALEIRLAAIQSLGALGEPPVLPYLIEWMQDEKAAVREAAKEAVATINQRARAAHQTNQE
jgi:hypothetical protein